MTKTNKNQQFWGYLNKKETLELLAKGHEILKNRYIVKLLQSYGWRSIKPPIAN